MSAGPLLAVPNISEGRDRSTIHRIAGTANLFDIHTDPDHHRSVLTYAGEPATLLQTLLGMVERAVAALNINTHEGVHPRRGVVDVLPFVPHRASAGDAVHAAHTAKRRIEGDLGVPVLLYGDADPDGRPLPAVRSQDPPTRHPTAGVVCVGVRGYLVAFNVELRGPLGHAKRIATAIRQPRIRALAFPLASRGLVQVSMNLTDPLHTGPRDAFDQVAALAARHGLEVVGAEVVGLVPDELLDELEGLPLRARARGIDQAASA